MQSHDFLTSGLCWEHGATCEPREKYLWHEMAKGDSAHRHTTMYNSETTSNKLHLSPSTNKNFFIASTVFKTYVLNDSNFFIRITRNVTMHWYTKQQLHKFSPLLRIDGEGSLPFSQGKTSFKWRPSCACVATAALPSASAHLSIRDVASWQPHHIDSTVCVTAVAEQVMSKSWQSMDTVFPRLHVS